MGFLKIDGMTSSATAENNCQKDISYNISLEDIIGEVSIYYPEKPDTVHVGPGLFIEQTKHEVRIYNSIELKVHLYSKSEIRFEISPDGNKICIYYKKFFCGLTKTFVEIDDICRISPCMAISEYSVRLRPDDWCNSQINVPVIHTSKLYRSYFVFNYIDTCKQKILALLMMLNRRQSLNQPTVQPEMIEYHLLSFFGYVDIDGKKIHRYSPIGLKKKYTCEYKDKMPKYLSMAQVKKLYELGMIKMLHQDSSAYNYAIVSDDAFDNDPDGRLQDIFKTKLNMHGCIERKLKELFL